MPYVGRSTDKISNVEVLDNITFDGSSSYTLQKNSVNFTPSSANTLLVSINGVVQAGNFTVSGSTINFGTAVAGTSTCDFILHYGIGLITTVSDGTVTTAKLADSSVSLAKLTATGTKDATTFLRGDNSFASAGESNTPYFRAYQSGTSQNLGSGGAWTKIQMNTETVDSASAYDVSNYRFTPQKAGYYFISGAVVTYNGNYTYRWQQAAIYKNGSQYNRSTIDYNNSNCYGAGITVNAFVQLNGSTDYVEFYCRAYANGNTVGIDEDSTSSYWSGFFLTNE